MKSYGDHTAYIRNGRDGHERPLMYATRIRFGWAGEESERPVIIKQHSTDIVTIYPNGHKCLNTGGWYTVTTLARLREFGSRHIVSVKGDWYVKARPDANDPEPDRGERTIPRPFHALDPGPEPVDDGVGCIAGTREEYECEHESHHFGFSDERGFIIKLVDHYAEGRTHERLMRRYATNEVTVYGEDSYRWHGREPGTEYKQCPHCKDFQARHRAWDERMNGTGWRQRDKRGYSQMCERLAEFGSRKGWHDAYLAEFRAVREHRAEHRRWWARNYVPWHLGHLVDEDGYAVAAKQWRRDLVLIERENARRAKVAVRVKREQAKLKAKIDKQAKIDKALRREIALNMASALSMELESARMFSPFNKASR